MSDIKTVSYLLQLYYNADDQAGVHILYNKNTWILCINARKSFAQMIVPPFFFFFFLHTRLERSPRVSLNSTSKKGVWKCKRFVTDIIWHEFWQAGGREHYTHTIFTLGIYSKGCSMQYVVCSFSMANLVQYKSTRLSA